MNYQFDSMGLVCLGFWMNSLIFLMECAAPRWSRSTQITQGHGFTATTQPPISVRPSPSPFFISLSSSLSLLHPDQSGLYHASFTHYITNITIMKLLVHRKQEMQKRKRRKKPLIKCRSVEMMMLQATLYLSPSPSHSLSHSIPLF